MTAIEARGLWKSFDGNPALLDTHLAVEPGSIHALVGENGAGKSTLIKALTGVHRADRGEILVDGQARTLGSVHEAMRAGISAVYQERNLVPELTVAENLFLHGPPRRAGLLDYDRMFREAAPWLARVGLDVDPRLPAKHLAVAQGQLLEIARALALESHVLLLDEPTASITAPEAERLYKILRELRDNGTACVFVSHKLDEVLGLCDRITVLRDGVTVLDGVPTVGLDRTDVITAMVGRVVAFATRREPCPDVEVPAVLDLRDVSTSAGHTGLNLTVPAGGIVGLYGLVGAGRTELAHCLLGLGEITHGSVLMHDKPVHIVDPHDALHRHRVGYVSENRKEQGLIMSHSISHNVGITIWDRISGFFGHVTPTREKAAVRPVVERLGVRMSGLDQHAGQLSGGNQQKVCVAKWLASEVGLLIVDEPTIGVDVRTKEEMYDLFDELARSGKAILLISSDMSEIVRLADRILVMSDNRIVAEFENTGDYAWLSEHIMSAIVKAQGR